MKFNIGDRVGQYHTCYGKPDLEDFVSLQDMRYDTTEEFEPIYGTVKSIISNDEVAVEWDPISGYKSGESSFSKENVNTLHTEDALKSRWNTLESEFKKLSKALETKLKKAAKIVAEGSCLLDETGYSLFDFIDAHDDLLNELSKGGWSTSSMFCAD